ncbi:DNA-directed RNA polymerase I subunit RPA34.5-domain-containing protein [Cercophora scortea]|uniref:DNA-directed RNA polymerase I subunit RPA34.5-domain-containing protein n=1 Tax=Cercophora scortea TaxID=314031 RepID=A0AAE0M6N7_9PEZI|nr:DNA-directed RNA polymerase I subunit RPA34.5-domain-containing protein [Cercophora scortea]
MAGPSAPIGTLSEHSQKAASLIRNTNPSARTRAPLPKREAKSKAVVEESSDSSESDSSSDSDSDSSASNTKTTKSDNWAANLRPSSSAPQPKVNGATLAKPTSSLPSHTKTTSEKSTPKAKMAIKKSSSDSESSSGSSSSSESESESEVEKPAAKKSASDTKKIVKKEESSSSEESGSSSEEDTKKPQSKKTTKASKRSSSDSSDSSDEESSSSGGAKVTKAAANGKKPAKKESSSSEESSEEESESDESESESEEEVAKKPKAKEIVKAKDTPKAKAASSSKVTTAAQGAFKSSEMVADSDSSDEESEEEADESMVIEKRNSATTVQRLPEVISEHFHLRKAEGDLDASDVVRVFEDAKAQGKQLWYFTAPASVPIEVIQKQAIPYTKIQTGEPIFAHEGADYVAAIEDGITHSIKVLVPSKAGDKYQSLGQSLDKAIHIKRVTRVFQGESSTAVTPATSKPKRPQPKGLKARYIPIGAQSAVEADAASESDEDVEMTQAPALLPGSSAKSADTPDGKSKKRKQGAAEESTKKSKKPRVDAATPAKVNDSSSKKAIKQTPIAPPTIPTLNGTPSTQSKSINGIVKKVTPVLPPSVPGMKSS